MKATNHEAFRSCLTAMAASLLCGLSHAALIPTGSSESPDYPKNLETLDWDDFYADMSELGENESLLEQWSERVQDLVEHPMALNSATKEELADLPFMNDRLVEEISYYLYRYGPMKDLSELRLIEGLDDVRYRLLSHLVYPGDTLEVVRTIPSWKTILQRGKHDIRLQAGRTLEKKEGYRVYGTMEQPYGGDAWSSTIRYGYSFKRNVQLGFTAQKDAGEPWINSHSYPDYLSAHVLFKDMGLCNALVLGDYSITLGQGLLCGQSFLSGKSTFTGAAGNAASPIKRHASSGESNFFRGMAFDVNLLDRPRVDQKALTISLVGFISNRRIDGNLSEGTFTSMVTTGLHRTVDEMEQRRSVGLLSAGWRLGIKTRWGRLYLNRVSWKFSKPLCPEWRPYNQFQLRGSKGHGTSLDYRVLINRITCFGEVAMDHDGHHALQCGLFTTLVSGMSVTLHYRNHSKAFHALHAGAFGENSQVNNERGLFASIAWEAAKKLTLSAYADAYAFPWMTYRCDEPSGGNQLGIQGILQLSPTTAFLIRFKGKNRSQNFLDPEEKKPWTRESVLRHVRLQVTEKRNSLELRTILDASQGITGPRGADTRGFSLSQSVKYTPRFVPVRLTANVNYFDIPAYENRITSFEPSLPGNSRFTSLYGEGCRLSILCCFTMGKAVQWWIDASRWMYADRSAVGTGLERVAGNRLTQIQLLLRLTL